MRKQNFLQGKRILATGAFVHNYQSTRHQKVTKIQTDEKDNVTKKLEFCSQPKLWKKNDINCYGKLTDFVTI